eukprot:g42694.t1
MLGKQVYLNCEGRFWCRAVRSAQRLNENSMSAGPMSHNGISRATLKPLFSGIIPLNAVKSLYCGFLY